MEIRRHHLLTLAGILFLGVVIAKPGTSFYPVKEQRECKLEKGKLNCVSKFQEIKISKMPVWYKYE